MHRPCRIETALLLSCSPPYPSRHTDTVRAVDGVRTAMSRKRDQNGPSRMLIRLQHYSRVSVYLQSHPALVHVQQHANALRAKMSNPPTGMMMPSSCSSPIRTRDARPPNAYGAFCANFFAAFSLPTIVAPCSCHTASGLVSQPNGTDLMKPSPVPLHCVTSQHRFNCKCRCHLIQLLAKRRRRDEFPYRFASVPSRTPVVTQPYISLH